MAKVVIIAPVDADIDDAVKLLRSAGNDVDIEEPSAKSMLHIVLGLFGPNAYGFGPGYAIGGVGAPGGFPPPPPVDADADGAADEPAPEEPAEVEEPTGDTEDTSADFNFESVQVDGEAVKAVRVKSPTSKLMVEKLAAGPKTTYQLNESSFSFWPAGKELEPRVSLKAGSTSITADLALMQGDRTELQVGDDLAKLLK